MRLLGLVCNRVKLVGKEALFEGGDLRFAKVFHDFQLRAKVIKAVKGPRNNHQFAIHAVVFEGLRVSDIFFIKQIQAADSDPGGGKPGQVRAAGRDGIGRRIV